MKIAYSVVFEPMIGILLAGVVKQLPLCDDRNARAIWKINVLSATSLLRKLLRQKRGRG